jgi:hypothetical protein
MDAWAAGGMPSDVSWAWGAGVSWRSACGGALGDGGERRGRWLQGGLLAAATVWMFAGRPADPSSRARAHARPQRPSRAGAHADGMPPPAAARARPPAGVQALGRDLHQP